jgi:hypothetical protein
VTYHTVEISSASAIKLTEDWLKGSTPPELLILQKFRITYSSPDGKTFTAITSYPTVTAVMKGNWRTPWYPWFAAASMPTLAYPSGTTGFVTVVVEWVGMLGH